MRYCAAPPVGEALMSILSFELTLLELASGARERRVCKFLGPGNGWVAQLNSSLCGHSETELTQFGDPPSNFVNQPLSPTIVRRVFGL